jgi:hypothetical protein
MSVREEFEAWQNQTHDKYGDWPLWQAAYAAGQEAMRERAAEEAADMDYSPDGAIAKAIRALPVE